MPSAVRSLLVLTVLLSAGAAVAALPSAHGSGAEPVGTVAASLLDTSWGDEYAPPRQ
ncbi:hypothetical protein ACFVFH_19855 [Streptomyces sp. NPDC057697]|uniref:hypothetical protein n=1 Tax=Streptomyces sp. NPDC057697 TaxID=3346219 RepID=UPI0036CB7072